MKTCYKCDTLQDGSFKVGSVRGIIPKYGDRDYHVRANKDEGTYSCTCCKFERDGILCAHVLRVMDQIGVYEIPEKYILKRWTWDQQEDLIKPDFEQPTVSKSMPEEGKSIMRYTSMLRDFKATAKDACLTDDGARVAKKQLYAFKEEMDTLTKSQRKKARKDKEEARGSFQSQQDPCSIPVVATSEAVHAEQQTSIPNMDNPNTGQTSIPVTIQASANMPAAASHSSNTKTILDPPKTVTKGRPKTKKHQHPFDIAKPAKQRKCSVCGSVHHDKRRCTSPLVR